MRRSNNQRLLSFCMIVCAGIVALPGAATAACAAAGQFALVSAGSGSAVQWTLTRGGDPFFVKGVAGPNQSRPGFEEFVSTYGAASIATMGGNAFKTYGSDVKFGSQGVVDDNLAALQAACDNGIAVAVGIDLLPYGAGGTGFVANKPGGCTTFPIPADNGQSCGDNGFLDYENADQVALQFEVATTLITQIPDQATADQRSAILFWVVGNEIASVGNNAAAKTKVYAAIDDISTFIQTLGQGQAYSTMTMTAVPAVDQTELGILNAAAPSLDLIGVNDYGGIYDGTQYGLLDQIVGIFDAARANGEWRKPWVLTEWGSYDLGVNPTAALPFGTPFVQIGPDPGQFVVFGTALYLNSTLQAQSYADNYNGTVIPTAFGDHNNVGSFVFDWRATAYNRMIANWFEAYVHQAESNGAINPDPGNAQRTAVADFVAAIWRGETPSNSAPVIQQAADCENHPAAVFSDPAKTEMVSVCPLGIELVDSAGTWVAGANVTSGEALTATITATNGAGSSGTLTYDWFLYAGANGITGGDVVADPVLHGLDAGPTFGFAAPGAGSYRLWAVVRDQGGVPATKALAAQTAAKAAVVFGVTDGLAENAVAYLAAKGDAFIQERLDHRNAGANPRLAVGGRRHRERAVVQFSAETIEAFMAENTLDGVTLVLNIAGRPRGWGRHGGMVDAAPLIEEFTEGNGMSTASRRRARARGDGPGVTWNCDTDGDISNRDAADCEQHWVGQSPGGSHGDPTGFPALHVDRLSGEVTWDVTDDVLAGTHAWIIKKSKESPRGSVQYYSREGAAAAGDADLAPRLILGEAEASAAMTLRMVNNCPSPHATLYAAGASPPGNGGVFLPNGNQAFTKATPWTTTVPVPWAGGRIWACPSDTAAKTDPWGADGAWYTDNCTWVEPTTLMSVDPDGKTVPTMAINAAFIEGILLPVEVTSTGGQCGSTGCTIDCAKPLPYATIASGCPTALGSDGGDKCLGMIPFCQANPGDSRCLSDWFADEVATCRQDTTCAAGIGSPTAIEIYGCGGGNPSGQWLSKPPGQDFCAALNRGVVGNKTAWGQPSAYYSSGIHSNEFAAWIHNDLQCKIYAFSYDDTASQQGGLVTYFDAEVTVTWCPSG